MKFKRLTSIFVCLILALSLFLTACSGEIGEIGDIGTEENVITTLIAASDFQHPDGREAGQAIIEGVRDAMIAGGVTSADGFFFCGDYSHSFGVVEETVEGIKAIKATMSPVVTENMVFLQGNHDAAIGTEGLALSGDNDPENGRYGVFVMNNTDYMWHNDNEQTIKRTAQKLTEYLNEKLILSYDKPIFILSHLPLNYSLRTKFDGDAMYANYIFDVLNEAGKKGLNIFFLFGHDHSNSWDDYIGGASVYLAKGDEILIAQSSKDEFKAETLNFTYVNAGYIGYYNNHNGADDSLTMTAFTITNDDVTIARYSKDGICNLKSVGVRNSYQGEKEYEPDTTVYESPQVVSLTSVTDNSLLKNVIDEPVAGVGGKYTRISKESEIKDGERYLLIYNSSSSFFMVPKVVEKENTNGVKRIGMEIEKADAFGTDTVYGPYSDHEWTFTKSGDGWLIGNGESNIKLTSTADSAITATFEADASVFTLSGSEDAFVFTSGEYVLNYNSRGLINGYANNPATFSIYEFAGYTINVTNGKASEADAVKGETIKLTADKAPNGKVFSKWVVVSGDVVIEDETSEKTSFVMPEGEVRIVATYTDK